MIKSIIIDDEPKNIYILKKMLAEFCPHVNVVAEAKDGLQGIEVIRQNDPALVFLDTEMPYGNAFDLLDKLMPVSFEIIFITAFNEYALKAFRYSALDYLLKPINIKELVSAVKKATNHINLSTTDHRIKNLLHNIHNEKEALTKIALSSKDEIIFVPLNEIIRCEASGVYTFFYLKSGQKFISSKNIGEYEDLFSRNTFFRVHHSHIINLSEVKKYQKGRGGYVEMTDGTLIDVAVRRKDEFLSRLGHIQ